MRMVERKYGQARRVWVFDRGIVREANLAALRRRGGQYVVGTPRTKLRTVERALLEGSWIQVRADVEAQLVPMPGGTETYVLCRSTARREKERAIRHRFSTRLEEALRYRAHAGEGPCATGHAAERGYYLADDRRPRDPAPSGGDAHARAAAAPRPARHHHPRPSRVKRRMSCRLRDVVSGFSRSSRPLAVSVTNLG